LAVCVLNDSFFIRSLLSLILVHTVLNNFYFFSFSLLKFLFCLVFFFLQLKNARTQKINGSNFYFCLSLVLVMKIAHEAFRRHRQWLCDHVFKFWAKIEIAAWQKCF